MESEESPNNEEPKSYQSLSGVKRITFDVGSLQGLGNRAISADPRDIVDSFSHEEYVSKMAEATSMLNAAFQRVSAYYSSPAYMQAVEAVKNGLLEAAKAAQELVKILNGDQLKTIGETFASIAADVHVIQVFEKSMWPLYLVGDERLIERARLIDVEEPEEDVIREVSELAFECLGQEWLAETHARWCGYEDLPQGTKIMLSEALDYHEHGDYVPCVAVLMNMLTGFLEIFGTEKLEADSDSVVVFNWLADKHGLGAYKDKRRLGSKDRALVMLLKADRGLYAWNAAVSYIVDVVLTNCYDDRLAEHNPLRNKICHGVQVNYGTLEHSLKSILVTDLVLRLGITTTWGKMGEGDDNENISAIDD